MFKNRLKKCLEAFTLIEIVIVLGIAGIIALFAYPSYISYLTQSRRVEGKTALIELASRMEIYYALHQTYESAKIASHTTHDILSHSTTQNQLYALSIRHASTDDFVIEAVPIGMQGFRDKLCQSFTLNQLGEKNISRGPMGEPLGTLEQCWSSLSSP
jgi:type IV pilus assembly protein PilE